MCGRVSASAGQPIISSSLSRIQLIHVVPQALLVDSTGPVWHAAAVKGGGDLGCAMACEDGLLLEFKVNTGVLGMSDPRLPAKGLKKYEPIHDIVGVYLQILLGGLSSAFHNFLDA